MSDFNRDELEQRKLAEFKPITRTPESSNEDFEDSEEEIEDEEESSSSFGKFRFLIPIIALAVVSFVSYAWYTDKFAISRDSNVELPIVKASIDPLREKPEDPGGMKIINRDKRVYDAISGKDTDKEKKAENILPSPEEPLAQSEIAKITGDNKTPSEPELINKLPDSATTANNLASAPTTAEKIEPAAGKPTELENVTIADRGTPTPAEQTTKVETSKPAEVKKESVPETSTAKAETPVIQKTEKPTPTPAPVKIETKEPAKTVAKAVTADDIKDVAPKKKTTTEVAKKPATGKTGYRVQLGSYRSEGDAEVSWKNIKKKFAAPLENLNNYIEKADLGAKGIYYRLQISGFKSEADARKICQTLTEKKQECFFVGK